MNKWLQSMAAGNGDALLPNPSLYFDFFNNPSLVNQRGAFAVTLVRATTATVTDQDSKINTALSGEARFQGMRRVRNLLAVTEDFSNAIWGTTVSGTGTATKTPNTGVAPDGTTSNAITRIQATRGTGAGYVNQNTTNLPASASFRSVSSWAKSNTAASQIITFFDGQGAVQIATVTTAWQRIAQPAYSATTINGGIYFGSTTSSDASIDILVWHPQLEDVTGQTIQTPAEYVSVGVLSTPWHGAGVDAVKYFPWLNGNTVASNVVTEAQGALINGNSYFGSSPSSSDRFSTPDSVAGSITGDVEFIVSLALDNYSTTLNQVFIAKYVATGYHFGVFPATNTLYFHHNGSNYQSTVTLASLGFTNGTRVTFKASRAVATGNIIFSYSVNGGAYIQIGATVSSPTGANVPSTNVITVGNSGALSQPVVGKIYRAQILNGINGTLAVDYNPNSWTTGTTWTSATSEVWTIQGNAKVIPNPSQGFLPETAATQLVTPLASVRDMTNAAWVLGATLTRARTSVGADGVANTATRLTGGAVAATNIITQALVAAASSRTYSVRIKRVTGTGAVSLTQDGGATWTAITSLINSSTYTQVSLNASVLNASFGIQVTTSTDAIDADFNQFEAGALATSSIPDSISVRNADVATLATGGWYNALAGTLYAEAMSNSVTAPADQYVAEINDGTLNNRVLILRETTTNINKNYVITGGAIQAAIGVTAWANAITGKSVIAYQVNDFASVFNNGTVLTDASGTIPTVTTLNIGSAAGGLGQLNSPIRKIAYYPYRMQSSTAQALTI